MEGVVTIIYTITALLKRRGRSLQLNTVRFTFKRIIDPINKVERGPTKCAPPILFIHLRPNTITNNLQWLLLEFTQIFLLKKKILFSQKS